MGSSVDVFLVVVHIHFSSNKCSSILYNIETVDITRQDWIYDVLIFLVVSPSLATFLTVSPVFGFSAYAYWPGRKWCVFQSCDKQLDYIYLGVIVTMDTSYLSVL